MGKPTNDETPAGALPALCKGSGVGVMYDPAPKSLYQSGRKVALPAPGSKPVSAAVLLGPGARGVVDGFLKTQVLTAGKARSV